MITLMIFWFCWKTVTTRHSFKVWFLCRIYGIQQNSGKQLDMLAAVFCAIIPIKAYFLYSKHHFIQYEAVEIISNAVSNNTLTK